MSFQFDRTELKFVVTGEQRADLLARLLPFLSPDANARENACYPIVSLYYDTPSRECYWDKVRGLPSRRKMRVRVYGSCDGALPPTSFLEIKHKLYGQVVKRRARIPLEMALAVGAGDPLDVSFLPETDRRVVEEARLLVHQGGFVPACCMRYDRYAYSDRDPESGLRITFDMGIAYRFENLTPVPDDRAFERYLLPDGYAVLEVKAVNAIPYWVSRLIGELSCVMQSHSKYCNALEDGDPVLHRCFGGPTRVQFGVVPPLRNLSQSLRGSPPGGHGLAVA